MPVQRLTTSAMSSSSTSSFSNRCPFCFFTRCCSSAVSCRSSLGNSPYRNSATRFRSYARSARSISCFMPSICCRSLCRRPTDTFSVSQWVFSTSRSRTFSANSSSSASNRVRLAGSVSLRRASRSISNCRTFREISSNSAGRLSISVRRRAAASSMRSMALSGKKRSAMYRCESLVAAISAASLIRTPWWISYRSLSPRRIEIVSSTVGSPMRTG